ncbi:C2H2 and C2HC zinc finger [Apiospora kogelbergensis]|uniref:C2H2 and C2HC zinc finger n=1 Tax=Apiospora kogelbergensis TaxID=1337665 RepID=UPI003131A710
MERSNAPIMLEGGKVAPTLTELSQSTATGFRQFLLMCTSHEKAMQVSDQERLLVDFGRFRIWTEQTGAALRGRDSLDDTLKRDPLLRNSIIEVFQQILALLRVDFMKATEIYSGTAGGLAVSDPSEEVLTSDSEYSDCSGVANEETARPRPKVTRLSLVMSHIHEQIGLLYYYSAIFRRPRLGGRYLHSKSDTYQLSIPSYELSHVRQKLSQWDQVVEQDYQIYSTATTSTKSPHPAPTADETLSLRLAAANDRRREQLRYWSQHPWMSEEQPQEDHILVAGTDDDTPGLPEPFEGHSQSTFPTARTFSSVARSAISESNPEAVPERTVYASSEFDESGRLASRVPKVPVESMKAEQFECPYCHTVLESSQMNDRNTWKRHVFRDLRPYTCTFTDCSNPDKLYATRRDWIYHEMQMHRRMWSCRLCVYTSTVKQNLARHLQESHETECQPNQAPLLLEASNVPMEESAPQRCCFCHKETSLKRAMDHIAAHLEDLALFVLHTATGDVPEENSSAGLSSLASVAEDIWQKAEPIPADSNLATREPPTILSKVDMSTEPIQDIRSSFEDTVISPETVYTCDECNRTFDRPHELKYTTIPLK